MSTTRNITTHSVLVADIPAIIDDPQRGIISLVGNNGGLSFITGQIDESGLVMGALAIETEHGTLYIDPDEQILISEENRPDLIAPSNEAQPTATPYSTGKRCEALAWVPGDSEVEETLPAENFGKVDFNDEQGETVCVAYVSGRPDGTYTATVESCVEPGTLTLELTQGV